MEGVRRSRRKARQAGIFALPPIVTFIIVRNKEPVPDGVARLVRLAGIAERVIYLVRNVDQPVVMLLDGI